MPRDNVPGQPPQRPQPPAQPQPPGGVDTGGQYNNPYYNAVYEQTQKPMSAEWQSYYNNMNQAMQGQGPMAFQNPTGATGYVNRQLHQSPMGSPYLDEMVAQQQRSMGNAYNQSAGMAKLTSASGQRGAMGNAASQFGQAAQGAETQLRYQDLARQQGRQDQMAGLGAQMDSTASQRHLGQMQNQTALLGQQGLMDRANLEGLGRLAGQYSQDAQHGAQMTNNLQQARIGIRPQMAAQDWQRFTYLNEWPYQEALLQGQITNQASGGYGSEYTPSDPYSQAAMGGMGGYALSRNNGGGG